MSALRKKPLQCKELVKNVFENTADLSRLCSYLNIPRKKRNATSASECFLMSKDPRKFRSMIFYLDYIGDTSLADSIVDYAEPPADPSITPKHVIPIFKALTGLWEEISVIPQARAELFHKLFSAQDQLTQAGTYYALYDPNPNWKELSCSLYKAGEKIAVQLARPHIQTVTDPSLTPSNISQATHGIPLWRSEDSYEFLDMPENQHREITEKFDSEQAKDELFSTWLDSHPCPTWDHVISLLIELEDDGRGREGVVDEVKKTYINMTSKKAQQILDSALQIGSLPVSYMKTLAVGVAHSGKTLSTKHIFKMEYDLNYSSCTSICKAPIFAFQHVGIDNSDQITYKSINHILAAKLHSGLLQRSVADVARNILKGASDGSKSLLTTNESLGVSKRYIPSGDSVTFKGIVSAFSQNSKTRAFSRQEQQRLAAEEELFMLRAILFFDAGGQPQCHELFPALNDSQCLVMLFIKLNERLNSLCTNTLTDSEGNVFEEQCSSLLTNEQMLLQFVHTMIYKPLSPSDGLRTMYMVIGTHKDCIQDCDETLAQKNERLAYLLGQVLDEQQLIRNGNDIIFAVDATNSDDKCFDVIRESVSNVNACLQVETPMCFLMFRNDVIEFGGEHKKRILSIQECQYIARSLQMDQMALEAALVHFNTMNVFRYMPSVLPGVVFIDPQMPLDSVKQIVQQSYKFNSNGSLALVDFRLWNEGVVTSEVLEGKCASSFVSGLFEANDALKLFHNLLIVAPLNESEFIMPAILKTLSCSDMTEYLPALDKHVAPLFLHFHKSCIANGLFCSTHTCMRSKHGWTTCNEIRQERSAPVCLFRNAVKLQHPSRPIEIMFIHAQKHFKVYLDCPTDDLPGICPQIRDMLLDAVDSAATAFHFTDLQATVAFQCPCTPNNEHTATPNEACQYLTCTITGKIIRGGLSSAQRVWLNSCIAPDHQSPGLSPLTTLPSQMSERPILPKLLNFPTIEGDTINIISRVGKDYEALGIILLNDSDGSLVDMIVQNCFRDAEKITTDILKRWIRGGGKYPVTWETFTSVLYTIKLTDLAKCIIQSLSQ